MQTTWKQRGWAAALALALAASAAAQGGDRWPAPQRKVECGPLRIDVYVSATAQRFHVVDQLSAWDNACHGQYRQHLSLDGADEAVLAEYAAMRQKKRWGQGLEQTFYTPLDVDAAIAAGLKAKQLTREQAQVVRTAMDHFAARADALMAQRREALLGAFETVDREIFTRAAKDLSRFTAVKSLVVPAFPLASPDGGGGGMDGGRLRWEIDGEQVSPSVLLHELTHAFLLQRQDELAALADSVDGLSQTLLGEGFAYAVAPGLYPFGEGDSLAGNVANDRCGEDRWDERDGYGKQRMFGLALRPLLREAFERGDSLEAFLPRARDAFLAVDGIMRAEPARPPTLYMAGAGRDLVRERMRGTKFALSMSRFNLAAGEAFAEAKQRARAGDLLVILVSGEDGERVPPEHADLMPVDEIALRAQLRDGKTIERERTVGALRVVLLAARTTAEVERLARESALLHD